jgi:hypothetical protein
MANRSTFGRACAPLFAGLALGALAACSSNTVLQPSSRTEGGAQTPAAFTEFPDVPVPAGAKMDLDRSLVLGARDFWLGRLAISAAQKANGLFDFYQREMPTFGWQEITSVRSETSVLTYARGDRIATVQIKGSAFTDAAVDIIISPRGESGIKPGRSLGGVEARPLR